MKRNHDSNSDRKLLKIWEGDKVKVKLPFGRFSSYMKVKKVGDRSVVTQDKKKWPLDKVSTRVMRNNICVNPVAKDSFENENKIKHPHLISVLEKRCSDVM